MRQPDTAAFFFFLTIPKRSTKVALNSSRVFRKGKAMSDIRILDLITSCRKCPNRRSEECIPAGEQRIVDLDRIASFCPLRIYPARQMAGMEKTISYSQGELRGKPFGVHLLNFIAAQLKVPVHPEGASLDIPLKDGTSVRLDLHRTRVLENPFRLEVSFSQDTEVFILTLGDPIELKCGHWGGTTSVMHTLELAR